ncbi:CDGSH-type Zn-finger protein [Kribbella aluminosa]|uniref:CDGSH-type Zn-finger protein n=1 Tax=Kribbella aluminosa TaxID=416017 RepID=A0ABS4UK86_9ACTN|nr:CDGSH iron-sulfur domain-containing protein [Kribbella aluminosa]MBP2352056.1 CDGSH-type Zn-finger protein [Kribbella aluminosa]
MTEIRAYPDGPLLVRGDFELLDETGDPLPAARRTIALCRCGRTAIPPLCDGTHTLPLSQHPRVGDRGGDARKG